MKQAAVERQITVELLKNPTVPAQRAEDGIVDKVKLSVKTTRLSQAQNSRHSNNVQAKDSHKGEQLALSRRGLQRRLTWTTDCNLTS